MNNTEMLKVEGFTSLDELARHDPSDAFMNDVNRILPSGMFCVYDARQENPGLYVVDHTEVTSYTEA